ncbi:energy-coupling factor transporter transmembrane protein EcfT [Actinotalea sp. Marseille-Q4924]|uniref:energy-coupling factor transporter transmembrane component T family protein n=1 Tax=Actinotalea sp. Marseille-Q4924 TaxID=2866571 RepID=UPI001CE4586F|nr:energy-coupling factor transporter transmembrane protein EcfT [Actinotalea sp. Marseille-Q4924]
MRATRARGGHLRPPWAGPLGLYHAGDTVLHRASPAAKAAGLAVLGLAVVALAGPVSAVALLLLALAAAALGRLPVAPTARALLPVLVTAAVVAAYQLWQRGPATAVEVGLDLVSLVLAATVVTATTRADRMLDALTRALRPLRRLGVRPDLVALALGLMIRTVPELARSAAEVRDAARARGLDREPRALLVPAALRAVGRARVTGDALAARGLAD